MLKSKKLYYMNKAKQKKNQSFAVSRHNVKMKEMVKKKKKK